MRRLLPRVGRLDRPPRRVLVLALATLLFAGIGGYVWLGAHQAHARDSLARTCLAAATPAAQAIFSYDYRTFDAGVAAAKPLTTGAFAAEYAQTTASLKATAQSVKAVVQAQVSALGVVDVTYGRGEVLVYLNQYRTNTNVSGEKVDQDRVVLTMVPSGKGCKVVRAAAI